MISCRLAAFRNIAFWILGIFATVGVLFACGGGGSGGGNDAQPGPEPMALEYLAHYRSQPGTDHLMTALATATDRAIIGGNEGIVLVDLDNLPVSGTQAILDRVPPVNARNLYLTGDYVFANMHCDGTGGSFGFAIVRVSRNTLQYITFVEESDVFYEKMAIVGNVLYVAAHDAGIRTFDITDPENPSLLGGLTTGFTDAHAIAVSGDRAYVADGAGGLKILDVTNPAAPVLLDGEDVDSAAGTAADVSVKGGKVYMAVGGPGLAVYDVGDIASRQIVPTGGFAEDMAWVGDYLAVSMGGGVAVFDTAGAGLPTKVAGETTGRRGPNGTLRICNGIAAASGNRLIACNWNFADVYRLRPAAGNTQPDINTSAQRLRFKPAGGTITVTLSNNGSVPLTISGVTSTSAPFTVNYNGGVLAPGESVPMDITYDGTPSTSVTPDVGGIIQVLSDDPDESPLPIEVYGDTSFLDPGEHAVPFSLPMISKAPGGGYTESTFTPGDHSGKVVWFAIYGFW